MFVPAPPRRNEDQPSTSVAIDPRTEQELRAFVGSNANFYLRAWAPALTGEGRITRVNFAAFFFPAFWLAYRKMYGAFFVLALILVVEYLLEFVVFTAILALGDPPWATSILVGLIVAVVCGLCANRWYLSHVRRAIARVRAEANAMRLDEGAYLRELSIRGRTSIAAPFLLTMSVGVGLVLIVGMLDAFIFRGNLR